MAILDQVREFGQGGQLVALLRRLPTQAELPESMHRRIRDRLPPHAFACRLLVPMLAIMWFKVQKAPPSGSRSLTPMERAQGKVDTER